MNGLGVVLSAIVLYLAFPNVFNTEGFAALAWIALVPFFYCLCELTLRSSNVKRSESLERSGVPFLFGLASHARKNVRVAAGNKTLPPSESVVLGKTLISRNLGFGLLFGVAFYGLVTSWAFAYHPVGYGLFVGALTLQAVLFALGMWKVSVDDRWSLLYVPSLWVVSEWVRACVLDGFAWTIGHALVFHPWWAQMADITGSYGLSFVIVLVNWCIVGLLMSEQKRRTRAIIVAGVFLVIGIYGQWAAGYYAASQYAPKLKVGVVQPYIMGEDKIDPQLLEDVFERHVLLTASVISAHNLDLVVWPETAFSDDIRQYPHLSEFLAGITQPHQTHVLMGSALLEKRQDFNSAVLLAPSGEISDIYSKRKLIPLSESHLGPWGRFHFVPGPGAGMMKVKDVKFGVAICSEDGYPDLVRGLRRAKAELAVVMLNDGWLGDPSGMMMHVQQSAMRAIETRMPIVRAANSGWSGWIDATGHRETHVALNAEDVGVFDVPVVPYRSTLYVQFGNFFAGLCAIFVTMRFIARCMTCRGTVPVPFDS